MKMISVSRFFMTWPNIEEATEAPRRGIGRNGALRSLHLTLRKRMASKVVCWVVCWPQDSMGSMGFVIPVRWGLFQCFEMTWWGLFEVKSLFFQNSIYLIYLAILRTSDLAIRTESSDEFQRQKWTPTRLMGSHGNSLAGCCSDSAKPANLTINTLGITYLHTWWKVVWAMKKQGPWLMVI